MSDLLALITLVSLIIRFAVLPLVILVYFSKKRLLCYIAAGIALIAAISDTVDIALNKGNGWFVLFLVLTELVVSYICFKKGNILSKHKATH